MAVNIDIDKIVTDLNGKADIDLMNVPNEKGILLESYVNGTSWYRVYSDGWCEQGGTYNQDATAITYDVQISFLKSFLNTDYNLLVSKHSANNNSPATMWVLGAKTWAKDSFTTNIDQQAYINKVSWQACGYIE